MTPKRPSGSLQLSPITGLLAGLFTVLLLLLAGAPASAAEGDVPDLLEDPGVRARIDGAPVSSPGAGRHTVDLDVLGDGTRPGDPFSISLPDGGSVTVVPDRARNGPAGFGVSGRVEGHADGWANLVVHDGLVAGLVSDGHALYEIRYLGSGLHEIREVPADGFAPEAQPISQSAVVPAGEIDAAPFGDGAETGSDGPPAEASGGAVVDILVVYTPAARSAAGGTSQIEATIQLAVDQMNTALDNSASTMDVRLAHTDELSYTETGNASTDLFRLRSTTDGYMDAVHTLRNTHDADLVSLYTESLDYGGLAYVLQNPTMPGADTIGFSVVRLDQAATYNSFAHEVGHNLGAAHNRENASAHGAYEYSYGHRVDNEFRTIMSYACTTSFCWQVRHFSNPDVTYDGIATGVPLTDLEPSHNALTFDMTSPYVAAWRGGAPNTAPVVDLGGNAWVFDYESFSRSGSFSDAEVNGPFGATVDWGEGAGPQALSLSGTSFTLDHDFSAGTHSVEVCVTDGAAATGCDSVTVTVTANTAPIVDAGANVSILDYESFTRSGSFSDGQGNGPFSATVDWGPGGPVSLPLSGSSFSLDHDYPAGTYVAQVCVTDAGGATGCDSVTVTVTANTAPIVDAGANVSILDYESFTRSGSFSDGQGNGPFSATVDWGPGGPVSLPLSGTSFSLDHDYSAGTYVAQVCVTDAGGATGCDSVTVTVTANTAPIVDAGANVSILDYESFTRSGSFSDGQGNGPFSATVDWGPGGPVSLPLSGTSFSLDHDYSAGTYVAQVCVTDAGGATGCDSVTVTVTANTAPTVDAGANVSILDYESFTRSGSFSDAQGNGPFTATVDWGDGVGAHSLGLAGTTFDLDHDFAAGVHSVTVCVTDAGAATGCDTAVVTVTANTAPIVDAGANVSILDYESFTRSGSFSDGQGNGPFSATVDWGPGGPVSLPLSGTSFSLDHDYPAGTYVAQVCVTDAGGATGCDSVTVTVTANTAPTVDAGANVSILDYESFTRSGSFSDGQGNGPFSATVDWGPGGPVSLPLSGTSFSLDHDYPAGTYVAQVCVTDAGGATGCDSVTVTVTANTAPTVDAGANVSIYDYQSFTRSGSFSDAQGNGPFTATVDWGDGVGAHSLGLVGTTFDLDHDFAAGVHSVTVCVTDAGAATGCDTAVVTVTANTAPTVDAGASVSLDWGDALERSGSFTDAQGNGPYTATIDYGEGGGPEALILTGTTFELDHTYGASGTFTVAVCVTDAHDATGCDEFSATVAGNGAPAVFAGADVEIYDFESFTRSGSFTDAEGNGPFAATVDYGDGAGPVPLALSGPTFSLAHDYAASEYSVSVCVTDGADGTGCDSVIVTVVANTAPVVAAGSDRTLGFEEPLDASGSFTDAEGNGPFAATVDYGDGDGPVPLALSGSTFSLANDYAAGEYTVVVCVTDAAGAAGCDSLAVTAEANTAPTVDAGTGGSVIVGAGWTGSGSFADAEGNGPFTATVDYADASGPQPLSLSGTTFTLDHTYASAGTYDVSVCVTDGDGATGCDTTTVTVGTNDPPAVQAGADIDLPWRGVLQRVVSFTDPGSSGPWTARADYGAGAGFKNVSVFGSSLMLLHQYSTPGTYTVTVCVKDEGGSEGCDTFVADQASNLAPQVDLGPDVALGYAEALDVDGSFTDPDPTGPYTATVDFGDGGGAGPLALTGTTFTLGHTYEDPGTYTVTVCVTDNWSGTGCDDIQVAMSDNDPPAFDAGPDHVIDTGVGLELHLMWTDPDSSGPWQVEVIPGDGSGSQIFMATATVLNVEVSFGDPGMFPLTACVSDEHGAETCDTLWVTAVESSTNQAPAVSLDVPGTVTVDSPWSGGGVFSDPDSGGPWVGTIRWGGALPVPLLLDGNSFSLGTTYDSAGTHTIEICIYDDSAGVECATATVVAQAAPVNQAPVVTMPPSTAVDAGASWTASVQFDDADSAAPWTVAVDYGPGSSGDTVLEVTGPVVFLDHAYATAGTRTVEVCVTDQDGAAGCGLTTITVRQAPVTPDPDPDKSGDEPKPAAVTYFDPQRGLWRQTDEATGEERTFFVGNPGDYPLVGDWDCDGIATPGLYRQSDGFVYLRNSNSQGMADIEFYFGDPGDIPLAGDFDGDGCDSVSIHRPSTGQIFVINRLGEDQGGLGKADLSYFFGNPGDKPFVGDFDGDGVDEIGLHRETTGFVYFRYTHAQGMADTEFFYGDPGDQILAGDWDGDGVDTVGIFRPADGKLYLRNTNSQGMADRVVDVGEDGCIALAGAL